jgi:hypothetical protein
MRPMAKGWSSAQTPQGGRESASVMKGEVVSSILTGSTSPLGSWMRIAALLIRSGAGAVLFFEALLLLPFIEGVPAQPQGEEARAPAGAPIDKFRILSQEWHRYAGLAVADITFENGNNYSVRNAVISCEFANPQGSEAATRGSTVFQTFPPGTQKVNGIEFSLREKHFVPRSCRVVAVSTVAPTE